MAGNPFDDLIPRPGAAQNAPEAASQPVETVVDASKPEVSYLPIPGTIVHGQLFPPNPPAVPVSPSAQPQTPGGWTDPQQYAEVVKGVIPGIVQSAGTAVQAPDVYAAATQRGAAERVRERLALLDQADRGEPIDPRMDVAGYSQMTPEQRARAREGLGRVLDQQWVANPTPVQDRPFFQTGEAMQEYAKGILPAAPGYEEAYGRQVGQGLGSVAFGLPIAALTGPVGGLAVFSSMGVGEATQRAVDYDRKERAAGRPGLTQDQIISSGLLGVGPGSTDLLPIQVLLGRLPVPIPAALSGPISQAIGRIGIQAIIEGVQEGGQGFLQDLIAREMYNSGQVLGENFWKEASVGAGVGGLTEIIRQIGAGMVRSAAGRRGPSQSGTQPAPAPTPEAPPEPVQRQEPALPWYPSQEPGSPPAATPAPSVPQGAQSPAAAPAPTPTVEQAQAFAPTPAAPVQTNPTPPGGNPFADLLPANTNKPLDPQLLSQLADTLAASRQPDREPDAAARLRGPEPQQESALEPLAQPDMKPAAQPGPQHIVTPDGSMEIEAVPVIVELDDLRLAEGSLQPRDRSRAEYTQGARERASALDPARLQPDRTSDRGAPIILIDGTVISGNGRTMSIAEVYRNPDLADRAEAYRASLGPAAQGMRQPVLVMQAQSLAPQQAQRFADLSNRSAIAQMSATERAVRDAQALGPDGVQLYQGGDFTAPQNRRFLQDFMTRVVTAAEMPSVSRNGELTQEGAQRLRSAVLASAYGDAGVLSRMLESTDDNVRSITAGLLDAAPRMAQLRAAIASGEVSADMDAVPALMAAINTISDLRSRRVPVQTWLAQTDAFGRDPVIEAWVKSFYYDDSNRAKRQEKVAQLLNDYAGEAILHRPGGLFADETTPADVLGVARRKNDDSQADDLFAPASGVGQGVRQGRQRAEGRPDAAGRQGIGQGQQAGEILAAIQSAPSSLEREARDMIRDAQQRERELRASGATPEQIASDFSRFYGAPVSAADVERGNVWWAALANEKFVSDLPDISNVTPSLPADLYDVVVSANPMTEGEAAPMDVNARPLDPQRMRGPQGGASVGPRLTPEMRQAAIALSQQGLNARQVSNELRQQFGQYVRANQVEDAISAERAGARDAAARAERKRIGDERRRAAQSSPEYRARRSEIFREVMSRPEMKVWLRQRAKALAEQMGRTVWTDAMVERLISPELRSLTLAQATSRLQSEFPEAAKLTPNAVQLKRAALGYSNQPTADAPRKNTSPFTPQMEKRLAEPDVRRMIAVDVVNALRAEFGEAETSRITPTTITNKRAGNPSIAYTGKTTNPTGFQWSPRDDGRSPDIRLAELMQERMSPSERASAINREFGRPGMPPVTAKAVQRRWEKIKDSVLKAQGDDPMFAVGGWDPRSWLDWIKDTPNAGREDATTVSRSGDQGGGEVPSQQPGAASLGSRSDAQPESGRADGVRQSFRVRDFLGRVVDAPPNSLGLRQSYLFLHPPKVTWPFVSSAKVTLKNLDSGVPNWTAKAHVSEVEPGVWQVMDFRVRKKQAADGLTPEFLDAMQSELGDIRAPNQMRPETYQAWRAWEIQGSRWAATSVDGYIEHRGAYYSPGMIRTLHAAAQRLAISDPSAEARNRARRDYNELSDLVERLPPDNDGPLFAVGASPAPTPDKEFWDAVKPLDAQAAGAFGAALDAWVGGPHDAVAKGQQFGLMVPGRLEGMSAADLNKASKPVRDMLRERYGNTITVYRGEGGGRQSTGRQNRLFSYTTDRRLAERFAGVQGQPMALFSEADIAAAEIDLAQNGEVMVGRRTYRKSPDSQYVDIYDAAGNFVTDTASVRDDLESENAYRTERNDEIRAAQSRVREVVLPVDDVIWATDRFNQREIIAKPRLVAPEAPTNRDAYINETDYNRLIRDAYIDKATGEVKASSRQVPVSATLPPVGSWRISDLKGIYGREIEHLTTVPIADLQLPELEDGKLDPSKRGDDERYAQWLKDGRRAPPIEVVQTERGNLRVMDGHRRALAAKRSGRTEIEAWVSYAVPTGKVGSDGMPIMTGLTFEMANPSLDPSPEARKQRAEEMGFDTSEVAYRGLTRPYDGEKTNYYQMFTSNPWEASEYAMANPMGRPNVIAAYIRKGKNLEIDAMGRPFNRVQVQHGKLPADMRGKLDTVSSIDEIAHAARLAGYDTVTVRNVVDNATGEVIAPAKPSSSKVSSAELDAILAELGPVDLDAAPPTIDYGYTGVPPDKRGPVTVNVVFDPSRNARSVNATFDPSQEASANLMAAVNGQPKRNPAANALMMLRMRRPLIIGNNVVDGALEAVSPMLPIVPDGVSVGVLQKIEPFKGQGKADALLTFKQNDGSLFEVPIVAADILGNRAIFVPSLNSVGFLRYDLAGDVGRSLRAELGHELVHVLRRQNLFGPADWSRLLAHANALSLLDSDYRTYLQRIGNQYYTTVPAGQTGRELYEMSYRNSPPAVRRERIDQEAVAHMVELYIHNDLLPQEVEPVREILDAILDGSIWKVPQGQGQNEDVGATLKVRPMDIGKVRDIAEANFDTPYAIDPVQRVPISSLHGSAYSPQKVDPLARQISANGWIEPIVIDGDGNVIEGQHRLRAMQQLGAQTIPAHRIRERISPQMTRAITDAARSAGIHRDQASRLAAQIAEIIDKEGIDALADYEPPRGFEAAWEAAAGAARQGELDLGGHMAAVQRAAREDRKRNSKLDMSPAARLERAKDMGFDTSTVWYHGANRSDRIAKAGKFDPKRATSGPMAFFTNDPQVASNYATGKQDTSMPDDISIAQYFTVTPKDLGISGRSPITVEQSWNYLTPDQKKMILERSKRVGYQNLDQGDGDIVLHPEGVDGSISGSQFDYYMKTSARGNPLSALRELWHDSGSIFGDEHLMSDIWRLAGYPHKISQENAPWTENPGVLPVYLRMRSPLEAMDYENLTATVIPALESALKGDRTRRKEFGADGWDKNSRYTPKEWVQQLKDDVAKGKVSFVWTSIPDKVSDVLKGLGYDGIIDRGNKGGNPIAGNNTFVPGEDHIVAIPFYARNVRSVMAAFDPKNYDKDDFLAAAQKGKTRLAALHNLSAENLAFADRMGGIAAPSVAVVKEGMGVDGFGEITLIGRRDIGDPSKNPVFDADAYSVRFPKADYKSVPSKKAQKLIDDLRPYGIEFDDTGSPQEVWDYMVNRPQPDEAVRKMLRSDAAQAMFLDKVKGKPVKPVMRNAEVSMRNPWLLMPAMQEFIAANPDFRGYSYDDPRYQEMSDSIRRAQDEFIALQTKGDPKTTEILRDAYDSDFGEDGRFFYGKTTFFHSDMQKIGKKEVDPGPTRDRLERALKPHKSEFEAWVSDTIVPMYGDPRIKVFGRMEPYTLDNITRVMTAPRDIRSQEGTMTFGAGNARAKAAARIGDLNEARNRADWQMASEAEVAEQRKKANEALDGWRNEVSRYYKWKNHRGDVDVFNAYDASMRALGAAAKAKSMSPDGLRRALAREDFVSVPAHILEQGIEAGKALTEAPVPYFESKPQRAVKLSEFAGAVIPSNASAETKALLEKHGIPYKTYSRNQEGAQAKAAARFTQDLAKQGEDTLFAIQRQRDQDSAGETESDNDWQDAYWEDLARKGTVYEAINAQQAGPSSKAARPIAKTALEMEASDLERQVSDVEKARIKAGDTPQQIAQAIEKKFGFPVDAEALARGDVWWRIGRVDRSVWTQAALGKMKRYWDDPQLSVPEIASLMSDELGRTITPSSVQNAAHHNREMFQDRRDIGRGQFEKFWTEPRLMELERIWNSGMSNAEMAEHMTDATGRKISTPAINQVATRERARFPDRRAFWNEQRLGLLRNELIQALSAKSAARVLSEKFGREMSWIAIDKARKAFGLTMSRGERVRLRNEINKTMGEDDQLAAVQRSRLRNQDSLGYYSHALEAARSLKQAKGTPEQMLAQLKNAGVKQAEIEATKIGELLQGKPSITRDEIVQHLEQNRVEDDQVYALQSSQIEDIITRALERARG